MNPIITMAEKVAKETGELPPALVFAEVARAVFDLASHPGVIMRLGLNLKFLAGTWEMTGAEQQEGLAEILERVKNAREEVMSEREFDSPPST